MTRKTGFLGLCVVLTVSFAATNASANDCCEFTGSPSNGCASAPTGQLPSAVCVAQGGVYMASQECSLTTGNCVAKSGQPQRACCLGGTPCDDALSDCNALFIPTVSQWGLAVMVLLVLTAGTVIVMRRRNAATA